MLNSAINILNQYLDKVTPYNFYSLEMVRGENNLDEFYYLCGVGDDLYVVVETDYVDSTPYQIKEAMDAFKLNSEQIEGWVARKDKATGGRLLPPSVPPGGEEYYDLLVTSVEDSYLRHIVLKVKSTQRKKHYSPSAYGYSE